MIFPIKDFESHFPSDILDKGLGYFTAQNVDNLVRQKNAWTANVCGTQTYRVEITTKKSEVISWSCNCPYDWGPVCKHVAAVLYAIRSGQAEVELAKMTLHHAKKRLENNKKRQDPDTTDPEE